MLLKTINYIIDSEYAYSQRQNWMATESSVLYYKAKSKILVEKNRYPSSKNNGQIFKAKIGAGLGVDQGEEARTFFIHYIN